MPYVPSHLEFLSRTGTVDGWPEGIDEGGKEFAVARVKAGFEKYGSMDLDTARRCIFDHYIDKEPIPACLKGATWDWLYGVTYRAILEARGKQVFVAEKTYMKKRKTEKQWVSVSVSKADVESLEGVAKADFPGAKRIESLALAIKSQLT